MISWRIFSLSWETDHPTPLPHHPYPLLIMPRSFSAFSGLLAFMAGGLLLGGYIHASLVEARYQGCILAGGIARECEQVANRF